jgi:glutaryl-CoA dehydrogenase
MWASVTSSLKFDDCRCQRPHILPEAKGLKAALSCLDAGALRHRMGRNQRAMDCYETAARTRDPQSNSDDRPMRRINWFRPSWPT